MQPCTYILADKKLGKLYIGVTSNLTQRVWQHKSAQCFGYAARNGIRLLVYFECHSTMEQAIIREKRLKKWYRDWKIKLIESFNPDWKDLYEDIL